MDVRPGFYNIRLLEPQRYLAFRHLTTDASKAEETGTSDGRRKIYVDEKGQKFFGTSITTSMNTIEVVSRNGIEGVILFRLLSSCNQQYVMAANESSALCFSSLFQHQLPGRESDFELFRVERRRTTPFETLLENDGTFRAIIRSVGTGKFVVCEKSGELFANEDDEHRATEFVFESKSAFTFIINIYRR